MSCFDSFDGPSCGKVQKNAFEMNYIEVRAVSIGCMDIRMQISSGGDVDADADAAEKIPE